MVMEPIGAAQKTGSVCQHDHLVEFYETESFLVSTVSEFLAPALRGGDSALVVATRPHRRAFQLALEGSGIDVNRAVLEGRYLAVDAAEVLSCIMVDGKPDEVLFRHTIGTVMDSAGQGGRQIRVYGEMVALLWENGNVGSALALEDLWNDLGGTTTFVLLCAYPMRAFDHETSAVPFRRICDQHTRVIPSEGYSLIADPVERSRAVAQLQQEAAALQAEVRRAREQQELLADLAYLDSLTGLGNRRAFDLHLKWEWALTQRHALDSFVVVADLDGFKHLNDTWGHAAGDQVLCQFTEALKVATRSTDIVARLGGDEFAVLLIGCNERGADRFEKRLCETLSEPAWPVQAQVVASLGHASLQDSISPSDALNRADLSMLAQKSRGRGLPESAPIRSAALLSY